MIALEYVLLFLAFGGTLISSLGPKREDKGSGFKALTGWGWCGLSLAFASLAVAGTMAYLRLEDLKAQAREGAKVQTIAVLQFQRELWHLLEPLEAIIAGNTGERQFYPCSDHFDLGLHRFREESYLTLLSQSKLLDTLPPNLGRPGVDWATYFDEVHGAALVELNRLTATYSGHIDSDTIWRVERLAEDLRGLKAKSFAAHRPDATVRHLFYFVGGLDENRAGTEGWLEQLGRLSAKLRTGYDYSRYGSSLPWHIIGRRCSSGDSA